MTGLITQNVDGLHSAAGHREVVDLHGRVDAVVCLGCGVSSSRRHVQARLAELNPDFLDRLGAEVESAPDGDADLELTDGFRTVACQACGGVLKPDVVFFGENVPKERVARAYALVDRVVAAGGALLVAGSSLTVMSGLRFVRHAQKSGMPVVIVNRGQTRGDDLAVGRVDAGCSETLVEFAEELLEAEFIGASWLTAEIDAVRPDVIVSLGAVAARAIFGRDVRIGEERGQLQQLNGWPATAVIVTGHPSAVLRLRGRDAQAAQDEFSAMVRDLRAAAEVQPQSAGLGRR